MVLSLCEVLLDSNEFKKYNWTFLKLYGIVSCYKEVQHYATIKTKNKEKQTNDRVTGNALGDAVIFFMGGGIQ